MAKEKLYKLRLPGISFRCPVTKFQISGEEEKPLPRHRSKLIVEWVRKRGLIPVEGKSDAKAKIKGELKRPDMDELKASIGLNESPKRKRGRPRKDASVGPPPKTKVKAT